MLSFFLESLLALSVLVNQLRICLAAERFKKDLTVDLPVDRTKLTENEIVIGLFRYFLKKVLRSFQRYYTANIGSYIFSFFV